MRPTSTSRSDPRFPSSTPFRSPAGIGARRFSVAPGDVARRIPIINIDRLHQHIARRRCHDRQQRWFERQERRAITGGAFGENGDGLMSGKCLPQRSEEHTSELQSLMRISYAVFCLKKKKRLHYKKNLSTKVY